MEIDHFPSIPDGYRSTVLSFSCHITDNVFFSVVRRIRKEIDNVIELIELVRAVVVLEVSIQEALLRHFARSLEVLDIRFRKPWIVRSESRHELPILRKSFLLVRLVVSRIDMSFVWIERLKELREKIVFIIHLPPDTSGQYLNTFFTDFSRFVNESICELERSESLEKRIRGDICEVEKEYF